jgi:hypothetical protein
MEKRKNLGRAKRIRVRLPFGSSRSAWDCRPFGFGRIVAPVIDGEIEVAGGVYLNLSTGALRADQAIERRSA